MEALLETRILKRIIAPFSCNLKCSVIAAASPILLKKDWAGSFNPTERTLSDKLRIQDKE
jgi:hypothetical protein